MNIDIRTFDLNVCANIESEQHEGLYYHTKYAEGVWSCTCPGSAVPLRECKHIKALRTKVLEALK